MVLAIEWKKKGKQYISDYEIQIFKAEVQKQIIMVTNELLLPIDSVEYHYRHVSREKGEDGNR